jgi:outer membrane protein TolC
LFVLTALLFCPVSLLKAEEAVPKKFSLKMAQDFAVKNSFESKRSELDVLASRKKVIETVSSGLPQINSSISYMNNLELTTMLIPNFFEGKFDEKIPVQFGTQHNATVNFQVNQLVFNGSYFVGLQTSKIFRKLSDQNFERTKQNVVETVTNTYYLILVSKESERILKESLSNLEKTHFEIQERHREGFVAETDVDLLQITVTGLKNSLQTLGQQMEVTRKLLKFQMGLDLDEPIELTDGLEDILERIDVFKLLEKDLDLERNIDFQLLQTQEKLSEMALKNEMVRYLPTVVAFYTFQWSAMRNSLNFFNFDERWFRSQMVGLNVNIPVFQSGAQKARVQQARIALEQARNAREQAARGLSLEMANARAALDSAHKSYDNTKQNLALARKVYNVTLVKYEEGLASSLELTQAHDKYLAAQSEYIQAVSGLLTAKNKLDRLSSSYNLPG